MGLIRSLRRGAAGLILPTTPLPSHRVHGPATRLSATLEDDSLPPNSSAEAALLPFASLFAETCYEKAFAEQNSLRVWWGGHRADTDLLQTSLLILYKNKVHGEFPELGIEREVALYKLQARLRLRLSMAIRERGVLQAAFGGAAGDAVPPMPLHPTT